MSRIITNQTQMTELSLVRAACKSAGIDYEERGNQVWFTSGALRGSRLDLGTGVVSGDSDYGHTEASLGMLRMHYSEAMVREEMLKEGTTIEEVVRESDGTLVLMWHKQNI